MVAILEIKIRSSAKIKQYGKVWDFVNRGRTMDSF